ncbi:MAG: hypothetical protein AAGG48_27160 [Planctomycetota bacterium]
MRLGLCFIASLALAIGLSTTARAQSFDTQILIDGLDQPTGITVDPYGNLYYTTVPTPGVAGGDNQVVRYSLLSGRTRVISTGEPEPVNLANDFFGNVYWTCKTAGVILRSRRFGRGEPQLVLDGLSQPSGIASHPFPGFIAHTEVPSPGEFGADNEVSVAFQFFRRWFDFPVSDGEPEPVDVAMAFDGTLYWTCKTAGVILKRSPAGEIELVLDNLPAPSGIDVDSYGRIYWTEVPTPGVFGTDGGTNRVLRYDPSSGETVVISEGEPEPIDVTVTPSGGTVYWTCRTAGVIIAARESTE